MKNIKIKIKEEIFELKGEEPFKKRLAEKAKVMGKKFKALTIGFFKHDDELEVAEDSLKEKKTNLFKKAKSMFKSLIMVAISLGIVYSYLEILGQENS